MQAAGGLLLCMAALLAMPGLTPSEAVGKVASTRAKGALSLPPQPTVGERSAIVKGKAKKGILENGLEGDAPRGKQQQPATGGGSGVWTIPSSPSGAVVNQTLGGLPSRPDHSWGQLGKGALGEDHGERDHWELMLEKVIRMRNSTASGMPKKGSDLARWLARQRQLYRSGDLDSEKQAKLAASGMELMIR